MDGVYIYEIDENGQKINEIKHFFEKEEIKILYKYRRKSMGDSWSGVRKRLEQDLLCDALKGRLKYFITKYNNAHDESGRVSDYC